MLATVAVPGPVRRLFSYTVPPALAARCVPGVRVLVPFGRRRVTAYLVGLSGAPPPGETPATFKPIEEVLDETPSLDADLLDLTRWAADYYAASWGDVIRAALPGLVAPKRLEVGVTEAGAVALATGRAGRAAGPTIEAILKVTGAAGRELPLADVRRRSGHDAPIGRLRLLARRGHVTLREIVTASGPPVRQETWVVPADGPAPALRRLGAKQAAVLEHLHSTPTGARRGDLLAATGADHATVRALAKRGVLRLETRAAPRTPIALETRAVTPPAAHDLTSEQASAFEAIRAAVATRDFATFLLFGVTGSGKTEVYLRSIEAALADGRRALYLVPEIGLTPLLARRMQARFGDTLALLHSGLPDGERQEQWRRVRDGRARVVLGARSAVFAPIAGLGLVVVDEEHDASYKQDEHPRYHGRDLAVLRASRAAATAILGSATPSMESYRHALESKYRLLSLTGRPGGAALPEVRRVDMRQEFEEVGRETILSRRLLDALRERLDRGEQSIVLLNRRGFSTFVMCRTCGKPIECDQCSIALTLHLKERRLRCHYCNAQRAIPGICPSCGSGHLHFGGTGTERLEETLASLLPRARIARMDRDTVRGRGSVEALLDRVERGEVDILMGTQMVAKGHDFPKVTLVGVLAADALLGMPDFRAGERTFQLLAQVAGRSGRRERPGEVIVQAWDPAHHAVRAACEHDFEAFARDELAYRRTLHYPPFAALALLVFRDRDYEVARERAASVAAGLRRMRLPGIGVLGPAPAPLERLRGAYRVQVMLKGDTRAAVRQGMGALTGLLERSGAHAEAVTIDVDPVSTL
jgi:primosomal protein N' (replication factor Y) (superfamily II helicase)